MKGDFMYQLVTYFDDLTIDHVENGLENVQVDGKKVTWQGGGVDSININFIIVDDSVEVGQKGDTLTQEIINRDVKSGLKSEVVKLREQMIKTQQVIDFLLEI